MVNQNICPPTQEIDGVLFEFLSTPEDIAAGILQYRVTNFRTGPGSGFSHFTVDLPLCPFDEFPETLPGRVTRNGMTTDTIYEVEDVDPTTGCRGVKNLDEDGLEGDGDSAIYTIFLPEGFIYELCEVSMCWFGAGVAHGPEPICGICCAVK
ncbi:hypothetical protein [Alkalihalobacterium sp. APHAB7]|uniref:hypothetical protein n=1 Tax=Alkalihalobacterium sp. APHAB7 TaxID=3402081 RepID=UPI003AB099AD